jgi:cephalosporin-C deacetylase-like acetyl esterase
MTREALGVAGCKVLVFITFSLASTLVFAQHQLAFVPFHQNGIYDLGEVAGWNVRSTANTTNLHYLYTVKENNKAIIKSGHLDMSSGSASIKVRLHEPAMILVEVTAEREPDSPSAMKADADAGPRTLSSSVSNRQPVSEAVLGAAIAPALLKPSVDRPADFDAFWQERLRILARIPIHPVLTPVPDDDTSVGLYTVKLDSVDSQVQGYLAKPSRPGKYPALIMYQYAGVYKLEPRESVEHAKAGWLTFDVDSHDLPSTAETGIQRDYYAIGNRDREKSYFLDMYLRDTRAVDYITNCPDWDGKTIVLVGTSMGGQQSLVTAALTPARITAVIVNEPSGADTNGDLHGRKAGYPYWPSNDPEVMKTSLYFDPVNFAPLIKAPVIISVGFLDTSAPPVGVWTVFNQLSGPKEIVPMIESAHNNLTPDKQTNFTSKSEDALQIILHGGRLKLTKGLLDSHKARRFVAGVAKRMRIWRIAARDVQLPSNLGVLLVLQQETATCKTARFVCYPKGPDPRRRGREQT